VKQGKLSSIVRRDAQDNADSGIVGKVQGFVKAGLDWLTTGRKRRGVLSSMQGMFLLQCSGLPFGLCSRLLAEHAGKELLTGPMP
jgi:hypothetical protein